MSYLHKKRNAEEEKKKTALQETNLHSIAAVRSDQSLDQSGHQIATVSSSGIGRDDILSHSGAGIVSHFVSTMLKLCRVSNHT